MDFSKLKKKVKAMEKVLNNTQEYRNAWENESRDMISNTLEEIVEKSKLKAEVIIHNQVLGLEAVSLALGTVESGIFEKIGEGVKKPLVRMNGVLMFQQLFNSKISIWINFPHIEGVGEPKSPKMIEIVRPHELKEINILRYTEQFIDEVTDWEDYDDDIVPAHGSIGFSHKAASLK